MSQLFHIAFAFPTLIWTVLLGVALCYWMFVVLGALDIDLFGDADVDGVLDGGGDIGGDIGGDAGVDVGGGDAGGDVGGDAGGDAGGDVDAGGGGLELLALLGLRKVPLTVSLSFVFLFAWMASLVMLLAFGEALAELPRWLSALLLLVGALGLSLPLTSLAVRPIAPLFVIHRAKVNTDYIGSVCVVTTGRVDAGFGQARVEDEGGVVLVIPVRYEGDGGFGRNDKALIIGYDEDRHAYLIEPMSDVLSQRKAPPSAPDQSS